ncbi:MAG: xanthine dehydrogenase family protein molybdopterin-binding subunit [Thermodesulfobacteriota bacterium]
MKNLAVIGRSVPRVDAKSKTTGEAVYASDLRFSHMIFGKVLRCPYPRAKILKIDTRRAAAKTGITVLTCRDIPGKSTMGPMIADQPILADAEVNLYGEAVALAGASTEAAAEEALDLIRVAYEPVEAVFDPIAAQNEGAPVIHAGGNLADQFKIRKGDVLKGFAESDIVIEGEYRTQRVEHAYLEPEAAVARMEADGNITVWAGTQHTHFDRRAIAAMLGLSQNRVRVIQTVTGGAFGGKIWSLCPCYAALLAFKTGRPAKVVYTREESIRTTTKRHPYVIRYKTGATREGRLKAIEVKLTSDTGPYMVVGKGVLARSVIQAAGPYDIPHVKIDGYVVYTNNPNGGAMRGYGGPQVALAHERQMDELARRLGMDPIEIREKNILRIGSATATGQLLEHSVGMPAVLATAREVVDSIRAEKPTEIPGKKRGVGIGLAFHGIGSTRGGSQGTAYVNLLMDGSATVICGSVDIGQGSDTIFAQIAAEELGVSPDKIRVMTSDSDMTPDCESTSGSRVTYISGKAVQLASQKAKAALFEKASAQLDAPPEMLALRNGVVFVEGHPEIQVSVSQVLKANYMQGISGAGDFIPRTVSLDPECGLGSPCGTYAYAGGVAEVEVDTETGKITVDKLVNIVDVGKAIHPQNVEGQIHGGISMGIGYALLEEIKTEAGVISNADLIDYKIPTSLDAGVLSARIVEEEEPSGPFAAKGFSEVTVTPVAAAILNAVRDAVGLRLTELPAGQERILEMLKSKQL